MSLKSIIPSLTEKLKTVEGTNYKSLVINKETNEIYDEKLLIAVQRVKNTTYDRVVYSKVYDDIIDITFYPGSLTYTVSMNIQFDRNAYTKKSFNSEKLIDTSTGQVSRYYNIYNLNVRTKNVDRARSTLLNHCPKEYICIFDGLQKMIEDEEKRIRAEYMYHPDRVASILSLYNLNWYSDDWEETHINDPDEKLHNSDEFSDHIIQNLFNEDCPIDSLLNMYKRVHGYRF